MAHANGRPRLDRYVRHAERVGAELVFETADEQGFTARELGSRARHPRRIDPRWRLSQTDRQMLAK
jgi:hypothetical protein